MKRQQVCGPGISEEFRVDVDLRQGSALSPLLFIIHEGHSPQVDICRLPVSSTEADLQERLVEWK